MRRPSRSGLFTSLCAAGRPDPCRLLVVARIRGRARRTWGRGRSTPIKSRDTWSSTSTRSTIDALRRRGFGSFYSQFGDRKISAESVIGVGDAVTVTIWEAGPGGLFSPSASQTTAVVNAVSTGANSATIPEQVVGRDGGITVPYAGRVHVAGKTTRAVQKVIEQALEGKAIQPQVLVNVTKAVSSSVNVNGEVVSGARVPLSVKGDRVLDVIAEAGGVQLPGQRRLRRTVSGIEDRAHPADHDRQQSARKHLSASGRLDHARPRSPDLHRLWGAGAERGDPVPGRRNHPGAGALEGRRAARQPLGHARRFHLSL